MIYAILVFGSLGGITGPAVQSLISRGVAADEQGGVQGSLSSLTSVAGILGPPIAAGLFAHFIDETKAVRIPGAAFFFSSTLVLVGMLLALRSFQKNRSKDAVSLGPVEEQGFAAAKDERAIANGRCAMTDNRGKQEF